MSKLIKLTEIGKYNYKNPIYINTEHIVYISPTTKGNSVIRLSCSESDRDIILVNESINDIMKQING